MARSPRRVQAPAPQTDDMGLVKFISLSHTHLHINLQNCKNASPRVPAEEFERTYTNHRKVEIACMHCLHLNAKGPAEANSCDHWYFYLLPTTPTAEIVTLFLLTSHFSSLGTWDFIRS